MSRQVSRGSAGEDQADEHRLPDKPTSQKTDVIRFDVKVLRRSKFLAPGCVRLIPRFSV